MVRDGLGLSISLWGTWRHCLLGNRAGKYELREEWGAFSANLGFSLRRNWSGLAPCAQGHSLRLTGEPGRTTFKVPSTQGAPRVEGSRARGILAAERAGGVLRLDSICYRCTYWRARWGSMGA